ncbi:MAG: lipopolysaccharide biosynthesis protein [Caulobacteraceae bacterium]|nr:lipopolysaccharide biosynthesis protein [Caulobacter sp.]
MAEAPSARGVVRRIYANLGLLLSGRAAAGLISLGYLAVAARALGPRDYGVLVLVHAYATTVGGVVNFPGWHAVVRYGAQAAATRDGPRMLRLLRLTGSVELTAAAAAVAAAALLAPWLGPRLGWPAAAQAFATPYSLAVLASARSTPAGYLQLKRRFDLLGLHNVVAPLVRLVGSVVAVAAGWGLVGFLSVWLTAALAEGAAMWLAGWWVARRDLAAHRLLGSLRGVARENPGLWRFMVAANSDVTFGELAGRVAPLAVGWILGPAAAGLYAVAQRGATVIAQPAQVLGQAAYAELARLVAAGGGAAALRQALVRCIGVALLSAIPVLAILVLFAPQVARLLAGRAFEGAAGTLVWLALARTVLLAAPPMSAALVALGRPGLSVAANLAGSLGLLPLLVWLLMRLGLLGAGVQALVQAVVTAALLAAFAVRSTARAPPAIPEAA